MKDDSLQRDSSIGVGPGSPLTYTEWQLAYNNLKTAAKLMEEVFHVLAKKICADSGLDPNLLGIHPHNAMIAFEAGNPWKEVDYNRVQAVQHLLAHEYDASKMVAEFDKAVRLDPHQRWLEAHKDDTGE